MIQYPTDEKTVDIDLLCFVGLTTDMKAIIFGTEEAYLIKKANGTLKFKDDEPPK